ncbi:MAG: DNA polymerase III subunit alpha, partial [Chloroflexi bacterium]|nr:DNA polymerase III subunit alpha [Chloroflexota bacterium]
MFSHLHSHSEYSLLDGLSKIPDLVARAQTLGQDALAITDHGVLYGAIQFYEQARAAGVKPIVGLEAYVAHASRHDRGASERSPWHLTLLAQNEVGYRNLLALSSASHLEGFYYRPRIDRELLASHSEGLIALSGCPSGELMSALGEGREQDARETAAWYRELFPGRYYVELQEHGQQQFSRLTPGLVTLARELDLPLVATNDSHYTSPEQHRLHDILLCIGTNATIHDEGRFRLDGDSFYLKSEQEMRALFAELPEACDNTTRIAEQVNLELTFGRALLPDPGVPAGETPAGYLRRLSEEGLRRRYGEPTEAHRERLDYELRVVEECGFVEYMLIVRDIGGYARRQGIPMGVRGSAAASIILYCLDVTDIEPTQYGLVFERFLNPERREMPDVDFDFADDRREEVIRYTAERFGRDRVAQIITFGTLGAKAAIRDSGRALAMSYGDVDRIARLVPDTLHVTLERAVAEVPELAAAIEQDPQVAELVETARGLEGVARHASTHAAGIVISREPLSEVVPLQRPTSARDDETELLPTTQYAMGDVARIGLLKMDYLGLTNLTILGRAVDLVREQRGIELDLRTIPDGDPAAAELLAQAATFGVFQMESAGMRRHVRELRPENISELSAMVALYRPGPMEQIPLYIDVKHGRAEPHYPHPDLAEILDETYGVITYQDQVLQIARAFAGYTLGQADVMRKAMGKKIPAVMLAERERFLAGATARGYDARLAEEVFDLIEPFAGYAFNKAHAFSYGTIGYQTAYLKAHYPVEFMAAVLISAGAHPTGAQDRIAQAVAECARLRIEVRPPDVNSSRAHFTIEATNGEAASGEQAGGAHERGPAAIRFGLAQVKNVGQGGVEALVAERDEHGPFASLEDFARRIQPRELNRRVLESLAKAGALDGLGERGTVVAGVDQLLSLAQQEQRLRETGQTSMFDLFGDQVDTPLPALELDVVEVPRREMLSWEKELLGTYITEHPFQQAASALAEYVTAQVAEVGADLAGGEVTLAGMVTNVRSLATRQGRPFAAVTIEDLSGSAELTLWPEAYERYRDRAVPGNVVLAKATVRSRGERLTVAVEELAPFDLDAGRLIDFHAERFRPSGGPGGGRGRSQGHGPGADPRVADPRGADSRRDDADAAAAPSNEAVVGV